MSPNFAAADKMLPAWLHEAATSQFDGQTDDLVTGGLGTEAMFGTPPGYVYRNCPTAAELRRASLFFKASKGQAFWPHLRTECRPANRRNLSRWR